MLNTLAEKKPAASHSHPASAGWWAKRIYPPNRFNGFVARSKPLKRLRNRKWLTAIQLKLGVNEKQ